jgi:plastocyanin
MAESCTLDEKGPRLVEQDHSRADRTAEPAPLQQRMVLPIVLPLLSVAVAAVLVLDISRVFLAGDEDAALVMGIALTVAIMLGATLIAAAPRLRSSTVAMILAGVFLVVSGAGLVSLGPSLDHGSGAATPRPISGPVVATLRVQANANLTFDARSYTAKPGVVQFDYSGASGHTLAIQDPRFDGFELRTGTGPSSGKVDLPPGTYTLYCTIPGHAPAGMTAKLTVTK